MKNTLRFFSVLFGIFLYFTCNAATKEEIDIAKNQADYLEQIKRISDANKAIAEANNATKLIEGNSLNLLSKTQIELAKATADVDKARIEADKARIEKEKSLLPTPLDPSKYRVNAPKAPAVDAAAIEMTYDSVLLISDIVSKKIKAAISNPALGCQREITKSTSLPIIVQEESKPRQLIDIYRSTLINVNFFEKKVNEANTELNSALTVSEPELGTITITGLNSASAIIETAISLAAALKPEYTMASISGKTIADSAFRWSLYSSLEGSARIINPEHAISNINFPDSENDNEENGDNHNVYGTLTKKFSKLSDSINDSVDLIDKSNEKIKEAKNEISKLPKKKDASPNNAKSNAKELAALNAYISSVTDSTKKLQATVDLTKKAMIDLNVPYENGISTMNAATQGELILDAMRTGCLYTLSTQVIDSAIDVIAKDGLFSGLQVRAGQASIVRWAVYNEFGILISSGIVKNRIQAKKIALND